MPNPEVPKLHNDPSKLEDIDTSWIDLAERETSTKKETQSLSEKAEKLFSEEDPLEFVTVVEVPTPDEVFDWKDFLLKEVEKTWKEERVEEFKTDFLLDHSDSPTANSRQQYVVCHSRKRKMGDPYNLPSKLSQEQLLSSLQDIAIFLQKQLKGEKGALVNERIPDRKIRAGSTNGVVHYSTMAGGMPSNNFYVRGINDQIFHLQIFWNEKDGWDIYHKELKKFDIASTLTQVYPPRQFLFPLPESLNDLEEPGDSSE